MHWKERPVKIQSFVEHLILQISGLTEEQTDDLCSFVSLLINEKGAKDLLSQRLILSFALASLEEVRVNSYVMGTISNSVVAAAANVLGKLDPTQTGDALAEAAARYRRDRTFRE